MSSYPLTKFEIQKYYINVLRFSRFCSKANLSKRIKDGRYVINLDENADVGTHLYPILCYFLIINNLPFSCCKF